MLSDGDHDDDDDADDRTNAEQQRWITTSTVSIPKPLVVFQHAISRTFAYNF